MTLKISSSNNDVNNIENNNMNQKNIYHKSASEKGLFDFGLVGQIIRRNIWLPVLALIGFVLALPVVTAIAGESIDLLLSTEERLTDMANDITKIQQFLVSAIIMVGALLAAGSMFRYLHVRRQIDFYHSLPVRREKFFVCNVLAGLLVFLVPYLAAVLLDLAVRGISGILPYTDMGSMAEIVVFNVLAYMIFFACTTLAMLLAGTLPSALKVLTCSFFLLPAVGLVLEGLGAIFYDRWFSMTDTLNQVLLRASVVVRYVMLSDYSIFGGGSYVMHMVWQDWVVALVLLVGLLAISLRLYVKRDSECAGQTLAFGKQKLFYKYPVVILSGLALAMFFYAVGNMSKGWLYFGAVFGSCFVAMLMEIMIQNDFRAIRQGWRGAVAATLIVCAVISVYVFDMTGFDDRLPKEEKIVSADVYLSVIQNISDRYDNYERTVEDELDAYWHIDPTNQQLYNYVTYTDEADIAAVLALAESGIKNGYGSPGYVEEYYESDEDDGSIDGWKSSTGLMRVVFNMQGGGTMCRIYYGIPSLENYESYATLWKSVATEGSLPLNYYDLANIETREVYNFGRNFYYGTYYDLDKWPDVAKEQQFVETLRREFNELSAEDVLMGMPVARIEMLYGEGKRVDERTGIASYQRTRWFTVNIYPEMTDTLALLRTVVPDIFLRLPAYENIIEINEYEYKYKNNVEYSEDLYDTDSYDASSDAVHYEDVSGEYYYEAEGADYPVIDRAVNVDTGMTVTTSSFDDDFVLKATYVPGRDDAKIREILADCVSDSSVNAGWPLHEFNRYRTVRYEVEYGMGSPEAADGYQTYIETYYPTVPAELLAVNK